MVNDKMLYFDGSSYIFYQNVSKMPPMICSSFNFTHFGTAFLWFLLKLCLDKRPMPNDNSKAAWPEWNWQFILFRHWDRNSRLWHGGSLSIFFLLQRTSHRCLPLYRPREFYTIINLNSGLKRYCLKAAVFQSLVRHLPVFAPLLGGSEVRNPSPF